MHARNGSRPAVRHNRTTGRRPGAGRAVTACLVLAAMTSTGCERTLCPSEAKSVGIMVRLSPDWPVEGIRVTVSCPRKEECGFLDGPVTGDAGQPVTIKTVLRPTTVRVEVIEQSTGRMVAEGTVPVAYRAFGPQSRCGGDATAAVEFPRG